MDGYFVSEKPIRWSLRQAYYREQIAVGDIVYLWRLAGNTPDRCGLVVKAVVIDRPAVSADDAPERWLGPGLVEMALRVPLQLVDPGTGGDNAIVHRDELVADPRLANLHILKMPRNTNYRVPDELAVVLDELRERARR